jgi:hypothetical protein
MQLSVNSDSADVAGGGAGAQLQQQEEQVQGVDATSSSHASLGGDSAGGGGSPGRGSDHVLEKPAKVIPCPRCASMNTKFCYFNNKQFGMNPNMMMDLLTSVQMRMNTTT